MQVKRSNVASAPASHGLSAAMFDAYSPALGPAEAPATARLRRRTCRRTLARFPPEHMRNKERLPKRGSGVATRPGPPATINSAPAIRSMRHGRRARELEGLFIADFHGFLGCDGQRGHAS